MYKVGDKIICKRDFCTVGIEFLNGCDYDILEIGQHGNYQMIKIGYNMNYSSPCYFFYTNDVENYFYTEKEIRKLKLEKLKYV